MEVIKGLKVAVALAMAILAISTVPSSGQIMSPCTTSMISSFTPCINFITGSSGNGSSPTAGCCSSLAALLSSGTDCGCLILTGNVPFQLPINRTLAIALPRACNMGSVPIQCKASASPLPAPGPLPFSPGLPPKAPLIPQPTLESPAPSPDASKKPDSPNAEPLSPTTSRGQRPVLTPSAAVKKSTHSLFLFLILGLLVSQY